MSQNVKRSCESSDEGGDDCVVLSQCRLPDHCSSFGQIGAKSARKKKKKKKMRVPGEFL
jgi:hypothetical protein